MENQIIFAEASQVRKVRVLIQLENEYYNESRKYIKFKTSIVVWGECGHRSRRKIPELPAVTLLKNNTC
jgi:hypothetical protein